MQQAPSKEARRSVSGKVCWFCKKPGDEESWKDLGKLCKTDTTINGLPILYHEACAAYSSLLQSIPPDGLRDEDVQRCYEYGQLYWGRGFKCAACGERGATTGCCDRACRKIFHFTCARTEAFKGNVQFAVEHRSIACKRHASRLQGPAEKTWMGPWMEGLGGWHGLHWEAAQDEWLPLIDLHRADFERGLEPPTPAVTPRVPIWASQ